MLLFLRKIPPDTLLVPVAQLLRYRNFKRRNRRDRPQRPQSLNITALDLCVHSSAFSAVKKEIEQRITENRLRFVVLKLNYPSCLIALMGLAIAAFIVSYPTVINVIMAITSSALPNTVADSGVLYTKFFQPVSRERK